MIQRFTKSNHWIFPIFKFRESVENNMFPIPPIIRLKLFSFSNLEGHCGGNQQLDGSVCLSLQNRSITNDLHVSIAAPPEFPVTLPFSSIGHHPSGPDTCALFSQAFSRSRLQVHMTKHSLSLRLLQTQPETRTRTNTDTHRHKQHAETDKERDR